MSEGGRYTHSELRHMMSVACRGGVRKEGADYKAFCVSHDDGASNKAGRSLVLHESGALKCYAGCATGDVVRKLEELSGVKGGPRPRAQSTPAPSPRPKDEEGWGLVEAYEYRDPLTGDLLAIKARQERADESAKGYDKRFRWKLPDAKAWDGLKQKFTMADMPLWGGEEIVKLPAETRVWFVEGEKACKAVRGAGEAATCHGGGSAQREFDPATWEPLRGRQVILWPDNDPPGRDFMRVVAKELRGIAKSIVVVNAPVPPKGDAFEYLVVQKGNLEDLLADKLLEPTVDVVGPERFVVRIPSERGVVTFDWSDVAYRRETLEANLTVSVQGDPDTYDQFINLKSQSTREGLTRALGAQFGKDGLNWTQLASVAYSRARKAYDETPRAVLVGQLAKEQSMRFLVDTLVPRGASSLFFGLGKSGKSTLVKRLALEVAIDGALAPREFLGNRVYGGGPIVVIDYEDASAVRTEFERVLVGMGYERELLEVLPIHFWPTRGEPLVSHVPALKRFCEREGVVAGIVDSAMPACGGEPEKPEPALAFFNGLNAIDQVTWMVVSHVSKTEADMNGMKRPYGSVVWENMPRRVWAVHTNQEGRENSLVRDIVLRCTATNRRWPDPVPYQMVFTADDAGPIEFRASTIEAMADDSPEMMRQLPLVDQLRRVLSPDDWLRRQDILELLPGNVSWDSVRAILSRYADFESERRGRESVYRLKYGRMGPCSRCSNAATTRSEQGVPVCPDHA